MRRLDRGHREELQHHVAVAHGVDRVLERASEAQRLGGGRRVEPEGGRSEGAGAER